MLEDKMSAILAACTPIIRKTIERFETAEILHYDGRWGDWPDLPIRLYCSDSTLLSVSWSQFDELWMSNDNSLPFAAVDAVTRWKPNGIEKIVASVGKRICGVWLGRGEMSVKSRGVEIWSRLLFDLGESWLEIFNAFDANGYDLHLTKPDGEFRRCI